MSAQIKENDDLEEMTERDTDEEQYSEETPLRKTLKSILITILSILCITGGVLIHKIHSLSTKNYPYTSISTNHTQKQTHHTTPPLVKAPISNHSEITSDSVLSLQQDKPKLKELDNSSVLTVAKAEIPTINENIMPTALSVLPETDTPPTTPILKSDETNEKISQSQEISLDDLNNDQNKALSAKIQSKKIVSQGQLEGFTLGDALLFKEHFLTEESCFDDYQKLLHASGKTPEALDVLNNLSPYCLTNQPPVKNVRDAFLQDKKKALIVSYREKNPFWIAYLKAIPASIIEIRKINPTTNKPKDILYKAQNEINRQNVSKAVDYVTQLPLPMKLVMKDFYHEAAIYNRAENSIDMLILSFEYKGE